MSTPELPVTAHSEAKEYWCFISYRHADNRVQDRNWATWLHQEIERYDVPAELVGTKNKRGETIPERIYPVFRDEESLPADADLARSIEIALDHARFLVVLCSPRAVRSRYVTQEIDYFIQSGRRDAIIPVILAGEPRDPDNECLPRPLRHAAGTNGEVSEPLAADLRLTDGSEGFTSAEAYKLQLLTEDIPRSAAKAQADSYASRLQLMKLKVIAGILGVPMETLRSRDKAYQLELTRKKAATLRLWLGAVSLLAILAASAGTLAFYQRRQALSARDAETAQREQAEEERDRARHEEAKAWLERAERHYLDRNTFAAAISAAKGLGFDQFGRERASRRFKQEHPILAKKGSATEARLRTIAQSQSVVALPIWVSSIQGDPGANVPITSVAFSPDGSRFAGISSSGTIRLWDGLSPGETHPITFQGKEGASNTVVFSPDGKTVATTAGDKTVTVWNIEQEVPTPIADFSCWPNKTWDGGLLARLFDAVHVAFAPDGRRLAAACVDIVGIWELGNLQHPEATLDTLPITSLQFSPDGQFLLGTNSGLELVLWPYPILAEAPALKIASGHQDVPGDYASDGWRAALAPGGDTAASFSEVDGQVKFWDLSDVSNITSVSLNPTRATSAVISGTFRSDGRVLATGATDGAISFWETPKSRGDQPQRLATIRPTNQAVTGLAFSPDGGRLVSATAEGAIHLWNVTNLHARPLEGPPVHADHIAYSPDGTAFVTLSGGQAFLWDPTTPEGPYLATVRDRASILHFAYSPDGRYFASLQHGGEIALRDARNLASPPLASFQTRRRNNKYSFINELAFGPKARLLISLSANAFDVWHLANPRHGMAPIFSEEDENLRTVAFLGDAGRFATVDAHGAVDIWSATSYGAISEESFTIPLSLSEPFRPRFRFSPDGSRLAVAGYRSQQVRDISLWSLDSMELIARTEYDHGRYDPSIRFEERMIAPTTLAFDRTGKILACGLSNGEIDLWDGVDIGDRPLARLKSPRQWDIGVLAFHPKAKTLAFNGTLEDSRVSFWNLPDWSSDMALYVEKGWLSLDVESLGTLGNVVGLEVDQAARPGQEVTK